MVRCVGELVRGFRLHSNKILVEEAREAIWNLYQKLKEYKLNPTQILNIKDIINNEFDEFVNKTTTYVTSHYSPKFD